MRPKIRLPGWMRCESASALVEFGIAGPLVVLLLMGVVEFGRLHWVRNSIEYATEQTARWVIVNITATDEQIKAHATGQFDGISAGDPVVQIDRDTANGLTFLTVTVTYDFEFLVDLFGIGQLPLRSEMRVPLI